LLGCTGKNKVKTVVSEAMELTPEVEIWQPPKKSPQCKTLQTDRQTTQCTKGATDSTVGEKLIVG